MAEYIEREAAIAVIHKWLSDIFGIDEVECTVLNKRLNAIPAADVVPVVRCRDCKHRDPEDKKCDCGGLEHAHMFPVADDWFCADGEREDGDGDV